MRIIPARAGFTTIPESSSRPKRDHPRSRGVYDGVDGPATIRAGSSPLARGLLLGLSDNVSYFGIIPARAGFTSAPGAPVRRVMGSSPLARGLHLRIVGIPTNP